STTNGFAVSTLWCPSDADVVNLRYPGSVGDGWDDSPIPMTYSSYACSSGVLYYHAGRGSVPAELVSQNQGIFHHSGVPGGLGRMKTIGIGDIRDGTSNTIMMGDK